MIVLRLLGRNCPEPALHGAAQAVTGAQPATAASVRARAVLARRERRDTVKGTARPPIPRPLHIPASGQVERAGPDQQAGPEASGVKAEWPRLGTRRGAQPANPTAARREAPIAPQILAKLPLFVVRCSAGNTKPVQLLLDRQRLQPHQGYREYAAHFPLRYSMRGNWR